MTCNNKKTCIEIIDKQLLENQENINQTSFQLDSVQAQMKELEEYLNSLEAYYESLFKQQQDLLFLKLNFEEKDQDISDTYSESINEKNSLSSDESLDEIVETSIFPDIDMYQEISLGTTQEYVLGIVKESSKTGFTIYYNSNTKIDLTQTKSTKNLSSIFGTRENCLRKNSSLPTIPNNILVGFKIKKDKQSKDYIACDIFNYNMRKEDGYFHYSIADYRDKNISTYEGECEEWSDQKNSGFVNIKSLDKSVFVHKSDLYGADKLRPGVKVKGQITDFDGKSKLVFVSSVNDKSLSQPYPYLKNKNFNNSKNIIQSVSEPSSEGSNSQLLPHLIRERVVGL